MLTNILASSDNSLVLLVGDFNQLSDGLITQLGFHSLFSGATHAGHCLNRIYSCEPVTCNSKAVLSTISTSNRAVVVTAIHTITDFWKAKSQHRYRTRTPDQHAALSYLKNFSWEDVLNTWDV